MSEQDNEELDSSNQPTEEVEKTEEIEETDDQSGTEDLEALQEKNKRLFERAKKAEAEAKILKAERIKKEEKAKAEPSQKQDGFSQMDTIALIEAKVTKKEDIQEVADYAKLKNISIEEALSSDIVKTILRERTEQRATAAATNTGNARRGTSKLSDEQILENVAKGKMPEDPEELAEARAAARLKKLK